MLENIDIYNVNFGDCFILESNSCSKNPDRMLVDFGSLQRIGSSVIGGVNSDLTNAKSKYLMVTHFHSDHYSGIRRLNNNIIFDEIYLPDYFSRDIVRLQFTLLSVLSESHPAYQIAYNLLSVIPNIFSHLNCKTKIRFVKRGEYIHNNVDLFRILWPKVDNFERQARNLLREVIDYYEVDGYKRNNIEELTENYFSALPETRVREGGGRVLQFEDYQVRAERIRQIEADIESVISGKEKPRRRLSVNLGGKISSYQNRICICFDNVYESNMPKNKRVLFLSDICRDHLQTIIESKDNKSLALSERYNVIKVPHHGTKDYFVDNLPSSLYMIVPNGYAKNNSWKITALYGWYYINSNFICADFNACDYSLANCRCDAWNNNSCVCGFKNCYHLSL